jgi:hypothetical protein
MRKALAGILSEQKDPNQFSEIDFSKLSDAQVGQCMQLHGFGILTLKNIKLLTQFSGFFQENNAFLQTREAWEVAFNEASDNYTLASIATYHSGAYQDIMPLIIYFLANRDIFSLYVALTHGVKKEVLAKYQVNGVIKILQARRAPIKFALDSCCTHLWNGMGEVFRWGAVVDVKREVISEVIMTPQRPPSFEGHAVVEMSCSKGDILALLADGRVCQWYPTIDMVNGLNDYVVKGIPGPVKKIFSGWYKYVAITGAGDAYVWGMNQCCSLGVNSQGREIEKPTYVESLSGLSIEKMELGYDNALILARDGKVYVLGKATEEQNPVCYVEPFDMSALVPDAVIDIAVSQIACYLLTSSGQVYAFGFKDRDNPLVDSMDRYYAQPKEIGISKAIPADVVIKKIIACNRGCLAVADSGKVFSIGNVMDEELSDVVDLLPHQSQVLAGFDVVDIFPGAKHYYARTRDGELIAWNAEYNGDNGHANQTAELGLGHRQTVVRPVETKFSFGDCPNYLPLWNMTESDGDDDRDNVDVSVSATAAGH